MTPAVVIVNWNSGERLASCLESLDPNAQAIVVDNASADTSIAAARVARPATTFILNQTNRGFAAAVHQGFGVTNAPYILVLNPDARIVKGSVEALERILNANPQTGAVGGYVNDKYLPRPVATPWTVIRENLGIPTKPMGGELVEQAAAAALLVRREAYDAIAGFDAHFVPAWYEDVDFCKRLRDAGWEVRFCREATFEHEGGYSARALGASGFAAAYYRNQLRYITKHFGGAATLAVRLSLIIGMAARSVAAPSKAGAYLKVVAGALGQW